jgi:hypothetical protein
MSRGRSQELELNFDGLTDTLTNLVGTLILFVFMMLGITHDAGSQAAAPVVVNQLWEDQGKAKPIGELRHQLAVLETELQSVTAQVAAEEAMIPRIEARLAELSRKSSGSAAASAPK